MEGLARLAHRLQGSRQWTSLRIHAPALATAAGLWSVSRGRYRRGAVLCATGAAGFLVRYRRSRREGHILTEEHVRRMRRLQPQVLDHFYAHCIGSMEAELEVFPAYDRHKQEQRYDIVHDVALSLTRNGDTVVDVGCSSAILLDRLARERAVKGIGLDLAPYGLRQRRARAAPPILTQAVMEHIPLRDGAANVVICSEVIEHLADAYAGLSEMSRITTEGGALLLTTNNASELPEISPLRDPLSTVERLVGRTHPEVLSFRNLTWSEPINDPADPLPKEAPTYAPHFHFAFAELRDLARDAGFDLVSAATFEYPAPQSRLAGRMRELAASRPGLGLRLSDIFERIIAATPGLNGLGTHHLLVFRKAREPRARPLQPWWPAALPQNLPLDYMATRQEIVDLIPVGTRTLLDVGCAAGALGMRLREDGVHVTGIELDPGLADRAAEVLDVVVAGDASEVLASGRGLDPAGYDCVVFADCLEHLVDPWTTLADAAKRLSKQGRVVVSLPNIRHWDTLWNVGVRGVWPMRPVGIHDRTHLRFFTRRSAIELLERAGLEVEKVIPVHRVRESRPGVLDALAARVPGAPGELLTFQWLLVGRARSDR